MTDNGTQHYASLRDYLRVLREQRLAIALCVIVAVGVSVVISLRQDKLYASEAALRFQDPGEELQLVGNAAGVIQTSQERAAIGAKTILRTGVLREASRALGGRLSIAELERRLSAEPDTQSNLVVLRAEAPNAAEAANIANTVATVASDREARLTRRRFDAAAEELTRRFRAVKDEDRDATTRAIYTERIARLQALSSVARPVDIAEQATVPGSPVSPKPVRNGVVAGFLGLLLGAGVAFLRNSLDRRLRNADEIRSIMHRPVVGHILEQTLGKTGLGSEGSVLSEQDLEAFRILRANLEFLDSRPIRTILITSPLPGEGKSTVATGLATAAAVAGRRTLLVEADFRRPTLADRTGLPPEPGLIDYLSGEAEPGDILRTARLDSRSESSNGGPQLVCIPAGRPTSTPAELLTSPLFAGFLAQVAEAYDLVVIDTTPLLSVVDAMELVPLVDAVVLCLRANQTTRDQARAAHDALERLPEKPTGLVVTGVTPGADNDYGYYAYAYAYPPAAGVRSD